MNISPPFDIAVHDPKPTLRELHFSFTPAFQKMSVDQRLEALRTYIETLIKQAESLHEESAQRGIITVIQITEQLLPHIQSDSLPLHEILIVELGEDAEGASLDELLGQKS